MPISKEDLPGTLKRSPKKAQRTYAETLDSAEEQYDSEARAHQTAWAAVKHSFEKVGDHWEAKDEKGPSDPQAAQAGRPRATGRGGPTAASTSSATPSRSSTNERSRRAYVGARR